MIACNVLVAVALLFIQVFCEPISGNKPTSYIRKGNITLGGFFPLHYAATRPDNYSLLAAPADLVCENYNFLGFRWMQSMLFAIEEINNRSDILPNFTLGVQLFDTCNSHSVAVTQSLYLVNALQSSSDPAVSAVIGPTESDKSTITSSILSAYDVPQISYASTSRLLSNTDMFNSFFRTIPSDDEQAEAIVDLLLEYNWTWVGAVAANDEYGRAGIAQVKEIAENKGICIKFIAFVSKDTKGAELEQVARDIQDFNATVFIMFTSKTHLSGLVRELDRINVTGKMWIASEAWATSDTIRDIGAHHLRGTLGVATRGGAMPNFRSFLEKVSPISEPENPNPFVREFWEYSHGCYCPTCIGPKSNLTNSTSKVCDGTENILDANTRAYLGWSGIELGRTFNVYLAVYVVAHALEDIMKCVPGTGLLQDGACPDVNSLEPWQLMAYIKKVNFLPPNHKLPFFFNVHGDPQASYRLVRWIPRGKDSTSETIDFVQAGNYSNRTTPRWLIDESKLYWDRNDGKLPESVCNPPCPPGTYRSGLSSRCCYECRACPMDEYSTGEDSETCTRCQENWKANANRTGCVPKYREYVRWKDGFGISICFLVSVGVLTTLFVSAVFYKKRRTPLVKATNVQLSFLLFVSIICCFLTPLFFIVEPQDWSCRVRVVAFIFSFTFSVTVILVKTLRVLTAFEARVPVKYSKRTKCLGENLQVLVVFLITLVQAFLVIAWLLLDPPKLKILPSSMLGNDSISIQCSVGGHGFMYSVDGYLCSLALVAFVFAFRSRKLPENFNEAKFITFAMLIFFIVWLSFIPAYLSTTGSMNTIVHCIAILLSTFGFIGCIFFPKLYVIFVTPSRNTIAELRINTANHAFKAINKETNTRMRNSTQIKKSSPNLSRHFEGANNTKRTNKSSSNNSSRITSSNSTSFEQKKKLRQKYVNKLNSLAKIEESEKPTSVQVPPVHGDSTIKHGIDKKVLSSLKEGTLSDFSFEQKKIITDGDKIKNENEVKGSE